jgi:hypothetical protein
MRDLARSHAVSLQPSMRRDCSVFSASDEAIPFFDRLHGDARTAIHQFL